MNKWKFWGGMEYLHSLKPLFFKICINLQGKKIIVEKPRKHHFNSVIKLTSSVAGQMEIRCPLIRGIEEFGNAFMILLPRVDRLNLLVKKHDYTNLN